ncbi:MAG: phosphonate ABC transporter, permease protein PhnE [Alphaproteobacteria bacterium]|nr:phosphonate ABC transporter, permease protein PhnE [Alphaproteobacteria bacterium]MBM3952298.1 phosphonate ABC transporter, permease protein PhnE [Rhodospirillales bacterium]
MQAPATNATVRRFEEEYARLRKRKRIELFGFAILFLIVFHIAANISDFTPQRLAAGMPRIGDYISKTLPEIKFASFFGDMAYWYYGFLRWLRLLFDTILIAMMASLFGALGGFLLCFPASRNLAGRFWVYFVCRRLAEIARTVPEIVYALIFVVAFGVGPFAGFLALTVHTVGAMGKLYAEANENIDERQLEGVRASGGNWFEVIRFAVLPQVLPNFTTYTLWRLELNIRSAAIVGFVGAGGIGQELYHAISFNYYEDVSAIVLMVVLTITFIDLICEKMRHHIIGRESLQ